MRRQTSVREATWKEETNVGLGEVWVKTEEYDVRTGFTGTMSLLAMVAGPDIRMCPPLSIHLISAVFVPRSGGTTIALLSLAFLKERSAAL